MKHLYSKGMFAAEYAIICHHSQVFDSSEVTEATTADIAALSGNAVTRFQLMHTLSTCCAPKHGPRAVELLKAIVAELFHVHSTAAAFQEDPMPNSPGHSARLRFWQFLCGISERLCEFDEPFIRQVRSLTAWKAPVLTPRASHRIRSARKQ